MNHKQTRLLIIMITLLILVAGQSTLAEPSPSKLVVNHETQECAVIFGGDECVNTLSPEGDSFSEHAWRSRLR